MYLSYQNLKIHIPVFPVFPSPLSAEILSLSSQILQGTWYSWLIGTQSDKDPLQ